MNNAASTSERWIEAESDIISGIRHAFNNRLSTLSAILQVIKTDLSAEHPLYNVFDDEVAKLTSAAYLVTALHEMHGTKGEAVQCPI